MKLPPVQTLIEQQNRESRYGALRYVVVPGVWLVIFLLNHCH
jgi:hypothetical protein